MKKAKKEDGGLGGLSNLPGYGQVFQLIVWLLDVSAVRNFSMHNIALALG
jgi:hypothetical protein